MRLNQLFPQLNAGNQEVVVQNGIGRVSPLLIREDAEIVVFKEGSSYKLM
jgi:hypothetical protein